jgi:hypothetical protein
MPSRYAIVDGFVLSVRLLDADVGDRDGGASVHRARDVAQDTSG